MKKKSLLSLILVTVVLVTALYVCADMDNEDAAFVLGPSSSSISSENLKIDFESAEGFSVQDTFGNRWSSSVSEQTYNFEKLNDSWQKNFKSFMTIYYADISDVNPSIKMSFSSEAKLSSKMSENIIEVTVAYPCGITLTVQAKNEDGILKFSIPAERIKEGNRYKLISLDFMPYMGAGNSTENGYMFYPDGCGAITYFNSTVAEAVKNQTYSWDVYGYDFSNIDTYTENTKSDIKTAMLPVFGVSKENGGFICFSDCGEAESKISMSPANSGISLNRIYFSFNYRTAYTIAMSNIDINGTSTAKDINGKMYNQKMLSLDHTVNYKFLDAQNADYNGMANAYRDFLVKNSYLNKSKNTSKLFIDLFMSVEQESIFNTSLATVTDFEEAEKIISYFDKTGCKDTSYTLLGWSENGYASYPQTTVYEKSSGKISPLLKDSRVSLAFNGFWANADNHSFSAKKDTVKNGNQNAVTDSKESLFILNNSYFSKTLESLKKKYNGKNGVYFEDCGKLLYRDFSEGSYANREDIKNAVVKELKSLSGKGNLFIDGANLYTLALSDAVRNIDMDSSEYYISDVTVPFLQMILHGYIPYTASAGNLASDFDTCLLRWIEFGCTPYFELTYDNSDSLKYTDYNNLFTSCYTSHAKHIEKAYDTYNRLNAVTGQNFVKYEKISSTLKKVTYSDGTKIYINYAENPQEIDGLTVNAKDFLIGEGNR